MMSAWKLWEGEEKQVWNTRDTREEEKSSIQQQQFVMKRSLLIHGLSLACFSFRSCNVEVVEEEDRYQLSILILDSLFLEPKSYILEIAFLLLGHIGQS